MNVAANGPDNGPNLASLLTEIAELRNQRAELIRQLAECQRENDWLHERIRQLTQGGDQ